MFLILLLGLNPVFSAICYVNELGDSGPGTLRDIIASASPGDRIQINTPGTIYFEGAICFIDVSFVYNNATWADGGAVFCAVTAPSQIVRCDFNTSKANWGGGLSSNVTGGTTLQINQTTFQRNQAGGNGGGVKFVDNGTVDITNSTFFDNTAATSGGGIDVMEGKININHVTITKNTASTGSGINNSGGTARVQNTIIAQNTGNRDIFGNFVTLGHNIIGAKLVLTRFVDGVNDDMVGTPANPVDAKLNVLSFNGGSTMTCALLPGSPAVNSSAATALTVDQRGFVRPTLGTLPDRDAFESSYSNPVAVDDADTTTSPFSVTTNVLRNDYDPDGNIQEGTITLTHNPANGTITAVNDCTITNTTLAPFWGDDEYKYTVKDNDGLVSNEGVVKIHVKPGIQLVLVYPNGGTLTINDPLQIQWAGGVGHPKVHLLFSHDGGGHWQTMAWNIDNTGAFDTFVPGYPTTDAQFKVVSASDAGNNDINDAPVTITGPPRWVEDRELEAEWFSLLPPMTWGWDGEAFNSRFFYSSENINGCAVITVNVDAGVYALWGRTLTWYKLGNSFLVSIDNGPEYLWDTPKQDDWVWHKMIHRDNKTTTPPLLLTMTAGKHTIKICAREHFTRLDKIWLTNNLKEMPETAPKARIKLTAPADSAHLVAKSVTNITWTSKDIGDTVSVMASIGDSSFNNPIVLARKMFNTGVIAWNVPDVTTDSAFIRICAGDTGDTPADQNFWPFAIGEGVQVKVNYAVGFDGVNDILSIPHHGDFNLEKTFTICFWMKTDQPQQEGTRILEKGFYDEYALGFIDNGSRLGGALRMPFDEKNTRMSNVFGPSQTTVTAGVWTHVAYTWDGRTASMYINGILETQEPAEFKPRRTAFDLIIGAAKRPTGVIERYFNGILDDLQFWSTAKSAQEIQAGMYNSPAAENQFLIAWYDFQTGSGNVVLDRSMNKHNGLLLEVQTKAESNNRWILCDSPGTVLAGGAQQQKSAEPLVLTAVPGSWQLLQNYPNPFNSGTTIVFEVPASGKSNPVVTITLYDIRGRRILTLLNRAMGPGQHSVYWDGRSLDGNMAPSGVYFYNMQSGSFRQTRRMVYLR